MFSRAAKSIVKTIGQRKYHAGEENIKLAMIGGAGEIGRSLSQMLKQSSKLDVLALYDVAALNKRFSTPIKVKYLSDGEPINTTNSRMLTMLEKSRSSKRDHQKEGLQDSCFSNRASNVNQNETEKLVESLRRLPIAEDCATNHQTKFKMESQGENAYARELQGPRVLAEMGPATFRHGGCIVSEICKQFPDFATYLGKNRSNSVNISSTRRRYSNVALLSNSGNELLSNESERPVLDFIAYPEKTSSKNVAKISVTARNNSVMEKIGEKSRSENKNIEKPNMVSSEEIAEKKVLKMTENRSTTTQKSDRRKIRPRKCSEPKTVEEAIIKDNKGSSSSGKSKNWTIPAALSDKKPKMLYGLIRQRRRPLTNFFSRFFDVRGNDIAEDCYGNKYRSWRIDKLNCIHNQKVFKEPNNRDGCYTRTDRENKLNASTSMSDLPPESFKEAEDSVVADDSRSDERVARTISVERSRTNTGIIEEMVPTSSNDESENDTISEANESRTTIQRMSSKIALFLENFRLNRQRSRSMSSLTSYNLESLFVDREATPILDGNILNPVLFSSSDNDSKFTIKGKLKKICGKTKKKSKDDDICKKRKSSCKTKQAECKKTEAPKSCGQKKQSSCKKRDNGKNKKSRSTCGNGDGDSCKSFRQEKHQGALCKRSQEDNECGQTDSCKKFRKEDIYGKLCKGEEDPCKQLRKPEIHGKVCTEFRDEQGKHDPCDKYWNDEIRGARCKKEKQQKKKKPDACSQKKDKSCDKKKKEKSSCSKKSEKIDKCENSGKGEKSESSEKAKCPPVVRAPGCSKDDGKSSGRGGGGGSSCRKYSTLVSRIRANDDFDHRDVVKDVPIQSRFNYREKTSMIGGFESSTFDDSNLFYGENSRNN